MMTSHSARTMREVSETVVIYSIYIYFWCKSLGRVTSKVENLVFYKHKIGVLFVEGFAEKLLFSFQSQSCSGHCLLRSCARLQHTSTSIFLPHCLSKVCVPAKEELFFCGLSAQVLHKLTAVVGNVLPFEAFFWHLLSLGPFPSFATISIASCLARSMTYVWKSKRTWSSTA